MNNARGRRRKSLVTRLSAQIYTGYTKYRGYKTQDMLDTTSQPKVLQTPLPAALAFPWASPVRLVTRPDPAWFMRLDTIVAQGDYHQLYSVTL